ncbi:MAG TPA: hypothetical protein GX506_00350 [Firmicutes bacterium]|nr:hypothetical protein [Bacillota bacterium]
MRCYLAKQGFLFVSDGISRGRAWSTYYRTRTGSLRRLKTMPVRETREAAQADLDAYAEAKRLLACEVDNP